MSAPSISLGRPPDDALERGVLAALNCARRAHGLDPRSDALWRWRTRDNPDGACLGVARAADGAAIAAIVGLRRRARLSGAAATFLEIVDVFNDFDARGGLARACAYVALGQRFAEAFGGPAPDGHPIVWGRPNRRAHRIGLARHGYEVLRSENRLVLAFDTFDPEPTCGVEVEEATAFPPGGEVEAVFERFAAGRGALLERDAPRLDWRFARQPEQRYRIALARRAARLAGWAVVRDPREDGEHGLVLAEWCVPLDDAHAAIELLAWAGARARERGDARLTADVPDKSPEWLRFQDLGFRAHTADGIFVFRSFQKPYVMSWLFANAYVAPGDTERG